MAPSAAPAPPVPVVDLAGPGPGPTLFEALRSTGSALLVNHGIDLDLRRRTIDVARRFFALTEDEKERIRWDGTGAWSGWQPVYRGEQELATGDRVPDLVERFECQELFESFDLWPREPAEFEAVWTSYHRAAADLASRLMAMAAEALDLPRHELTAWTDGQYANLVANHYLPQPQPPLPGQTRVGAHTDRGGFTLLTADEAPGGLEVRPRGGEWTPVTIPDDAYVFQAGDLFSRWTNGSIPANLHRVVNPPAEVAATASRLALVYFHYPALDAEVTPAPSLVDDDHPALPTMRSGDHLLFRQEAYRSGAEDRLVGY